MLTHQFLRIYQASVATCAVVALLCLACCQSAQQPQFRYSWSYDDMVSGCKPWVSLQVGIENDTNVLNVSLTLSISSVISGRVRVHTSRTNFTARNRVPCLYHGKIINTDESVFASSIKGVLKMTFKFNDGWYRIVKLMSSSEPAAAHKFELDEGGLSRCYYKVPPTELNELKLDGINHKVSADPVGRKKRSLTFLSFQDAAPTKVLELVVVLDRSFVNKAGSEGSAVTRVMEITNYVNGAYQRLSLRVVLTNIIIWPSDAFTITTSPDDTLNSFTLYKDKYSEAISTAWTMTHEIGHNLGFSHVEDVPGCTCSKPGGCIMNSYLSSTYRLQVLDWSSCSLATWGSGANATWRTCLADTPDASYYTSRSPMCGNGILEAGEQCDCGPAATCPSTCCDATTCRFKSGAVCASGPCCDWSSCTLRPRGDQCRSAVGPCDVPETCSGTSEWCPSDDKVADGVDCANGQAYCYNGQCKTADAQCQAIFSSGASTASSICFSNLNTRGDIFGHCDMRLQSVNYVSSGFNRTYSFASCTSANTGCGLLQCYQSTAPSSGSRVTIGSTTCYSQPRIDFSSTGLRSPSFVPDGAKCGTNSMCINSSCTSLSSVRSCPGCPNCNGNGVLTKANVCFCASNFAPPNCTAAGCGGSVTSPLACFDPNRTTIRQPSTTAASGSASSPTVQDGASGATIFGLPMWQFIAIVAAIAAALFIAVLAAVIHTCKRSHRHKRARSQARRQQQQQQQGQQQQGQQHRSQQPSSRPRTAHVQQPPPPPPPPPTPQQQQQLHRPPPQPQLPPPRPGTGGGNHYYYQEQYHNQAFRPDHEFNSPPPYQVAPSAPPPPYTPAVPSVYTVSPPQAGGPDLRGPRYY